MPTYIENCNCRGLRPTGIVGLRHNMRPEVVGKLIKDRHVPRYIIAPDGYGKSSLAFEYAQLVFEFENVFWFKCTSPCFLRDLDNGIILDGIRRSDPDFQLVVFDDVPMMDSQRSESFNALIEALLLAGSEVLVTSTPSADSFSMLQMDKMLINGYDLLLTAEELELERLRGNLPGESTLQLRASSKAPAQIWGDEGSKRIVARLASEDLPQDAKSVMLAILILGRGMVEDLEAAFYDHDIDDALRFLCDNYPISGIDLDDRSFGSADVPISVLRKAWDACSNGAFGDVGESARIVRYLASVLVKGGSLGRAIEAVTAFSTRDDEMAWLAENGFHLLASGAAFDIWHAVHNLRRSASKPLWQLAAIDAWSAWMLGASKVAAGICKSELRSRTLDAESNICLKMLAAFIDSEQDGKLKLDELQHAMSIDSKPKSHEGSPEGDEDGQPIAWPDWLRIANAFSREGQNDLMSSVASIAELAQVCAEEAKGTYDEGAASASDDRDALSALATSLISLLFGAALVKADRDCADDIQAEASALLGRSASSVIDSDPAERMPFLRGMVASKILDAFPEMARSAGDACNKTLESEAESYERILSGEMSRYIAYEEGRRDHRVRYDMTHTGTEASLTLRRSAQEKVRATIPTLFIDLFGGFSAKVRDEEYQVKRITRAKSKKALALLAMSRGSEVSKERMGKLLWPEADAPTASRNFYVVWANLKKSLSIEGNCPYLIKSHMGYKLDMRHVRIDLDGFEEICRRLLFGKDDVGEWEALYEKVAGTYSAELLPEFMDDADFEKTRRACSMKLVDGLVSASARMLDAGENRGAVWFAREALQHDDLREDVYKVLIRSYIATEQRASALDAYFQCRNRLRDELGIDPSPGIVALYRSIIETEENM